MSSRRIVPSCPPTLSLPGQALFPWPYGEPLNDARTPLADVFRILLETGLVGEQNDRNLPVMNMKNHAAEQSREEGQVVMLLLGDVLSNFH